MAHGPRKGWVLVERRPAGYWLALARRAVVAGRVRFLPTGPTAGPYATANAAAHAAHAAGFTMPHQDRSWLPQAAARSSDPFTPQEA